ncbi:hypothetical protein N7463_002290 [Penicillium fimorum]|uniref:Uncharacterized protein n=1 Tax=Penicillium fimorum TaxID=1882269 RepID=A0A9W9XYW0_9EURO|nr:hypothetical protein N7463_002290 [Penicillium fimorum]
MSEIHRRSDGAKVLALAFGYKDSFVISIGHATRSAVHEGCSHRMNLNGYYKDLRRFVKSNALLEILAIALDPKIKTDYILIYRNGDDIPRINWICSDPKRERVISDWWLRECTPN